MANIGGSQSEAFGLGINHQVNAGHANAGSITLGSDAGLDATSQRWAATTPHAVLASTVSGSDDGAFERLQRAAGGYAPGSMPQMADQLNNGSNDNTP